MEKETEEKKYEGAICSEKMGTIRRWRVGLGDSQTQSSLFSCSLGKNHISLCTILLHYSDNNSQIHILHGSKKEHQGKTKSETC
jgi:hypothetical protein